MAKAAASNSPSTVSVIPMPQAPSPAHEPLHDVVHQVRLVREALQSEKRRLGFFLGAGCPLGIYDKEGKYSIKHIPDVAGLTTAIGSALESDADFKECWTKLTTACKTTKCPTPNIEHILTQLRTICALKGTANVGGMTTAALEKLDTKICGLIVTTVGKALPDYTTSYHRVAAWIGQLERIHAVEIFTPNYDLLMEQALEHYKVPFFDGFVGTREPFFDLAAMEQDAIPPRWIRNVEITWLDQLDQKGRRVGVPLSSRQGRAASSHLSLASQIRPKPKDALPRND